MLKRVHGELRNLNWRPARPNPFRKMLPPGKRKTIVPVQIEPMDIGKVGIWDQGQLGSCTAHGTGFLWAYQYFVEHQMPVMPSRLFIYYCERMIENDIDQDNGAIVADGLDALLTYGVPNESDWPYDISQFATKPPALCWANGLQFKGLEKNGVNLDVDSLRSALQYGLPVTFGFTVFESFMSDSWMKSGMMPVPESGEEIDGGHCVAFVGDEPKENAFWVRNSWGADWCQSGRFLFPYDCLKIASDGWTLPKVS